MHDARSVVNGGPSGPRCPYLRAATGGYSKPAEPAVTHGLHRSALYPPLHTLPCLLYLARGHWKGRRGATLTLTRSTAP